MGNFDRRDGRRGGGEGFRPGNRPVTMHRAICSNCGQNCEVPFRPTGDKPVYCNNCFGKIRAASNGAGGGDRGRDNRAPRRDFGGGDSPRPRNDGNADVLRQLTEINTKLERIVRVMEKPAPAAIPETTKQSTLKQAVNKAVNSKKKK